MKHTSLLASTLLGASLLVSQTLWGADFSWVGSSADSSWHTAANWSPAQVPGVGDSVIIDSASDTIVLSESTAQLASLTLTGSTLAATNWNTCIQAGSVTLGAGTTLTTLGLCSDAVDGEYVNASRIWIQCHDLTVAEGASIDVTEKGFFTFPGNNPLPPTGPVDARGDERNRGGSHGGSVLQGFFGGNKPRMGVYGNLEAPIDPGAPGHGWRGQGGQGGGAIRIDATGTVTICGELRADGGIGNAVLRPEYGSAGAGGSIYITCNQFIGEEGVISAKGGDGGYAGPSWGYSRQNGAGGRIAIVYDTASQRASSIQGMVFDVGCGALTDSWAISNIAECGTLYFPDSKLFLDQQGSGFGGALHIPNFTSMTTEGDFVVNHQLRMGFEGFTLHVRGDLLVSGPTARFEMGGSEVVYPSGAYQYTTYNSGSTPWKIQVDGDFRIENGAKFEAYPATAPMLDEATGYGAFVQVEGKLLVGPDSVLVARSVPTNGASVAFTTGSVDIQPRGLFNTDGYGWDAKCGPGAGLDAGRGGGYGGVGAYAVTEGNRMQGCTYGDPLHPWQPGSGGASWGVSRYMRGGGGAIRITASGNINVDGALLASSFSATKGDATWSGASGGSIYLSCRTFTGSGELHADGGSILNNTRNTTNVSAGGGGRIAVYTGIPFNPETMSEEHNFLRHESTPPDSFTGIATAAAGLFTRANDPEIVLEQSGQAGTLHFIHVAEPATILLLK